MVIFANFTLHGWVKQGNLRQQTRIACNIKWIYHTSLFAPYLKKNDVFCLSSNSIDLYQLMLRYNVRINAMFISQKYRESSKMAMRRKSSGVRSSRRHSDRKRSNRSRSDHKAPAPPTPVTPATKPPAPAPASPAPPASLNIRAPTPSEQLPLYADSQATFSVQALQRETSI